MKRYGALIIMVFAFVLAMGAIADAAATVDKTASVTASLLITGTTSLSVTPASIDYGTASTDAYPTTPANKKVVLSYSSNFNPWKVAIYTNNTAVPNAGLPGGKLQKGGLVAGTAPNQNLVACKWVSKVGTNVTVPAVPTATTFNFVKDKRDEDDPATTTNDESWATAFASGYANIASGDSSGNGNCVDPTDNSTVDGDGLFVGDPVTPTSGIAAYIAAGVGTNFVSPAVAAGAGSYSGTFYFDLYHE